MSSSLREGTAYQRGYQSGVGKRDVMSMKRRLAVFLLLYIFDRVCKQCEGVHSTSFPSLIWFHCGSYNSFMCRKYIYSTHVL